VPYRIDVRDVSAEALDRLIELGALDVESVQGGIAAIMPDSVSSARVAHALGRRIVRATPARGRDDDSVWLVHAGRVQAGRLLIVPAECSTEPGALRMVDGPAFGTGLHPTTALCLEILDEELTACRPSAVLDVGTGSGVLALAALHWNAPRAVALDLDAAAIRIARENARVNGFSSRLKILQGGPQALSGAWPLVLANILTAPLIEMAPTLTRRVGHGGRLVLSGIRSSLAPAVEQAYRRAGMRQANARERGGWTALTLHASW
jgi:ribosomal protein L11 methyltransferase